MLVAGKCSQTAENRTRMTQWNAMENGTRMTRIYMDFLKKIKIEIYNYE
jgi:hypothetical protein